jgi:protein-S-isoprenylcysteine O-methyltransferase Ste14
MTISATTIVLANFLMIGILPRIFFRKDGSFNLMWWVTASPIFLNAIVVFLGQINILSVSIALPMAIGQIMSVILSVASISMISMTLGTHRVPLALWHQENDAPKQIVTWGTYKYIRHPFYTSFITAQIASVLYFPHILNLVGLLAAIIVLNQTASREERRLSSSTYGQEYIDYIKTTGRFFPKLF